MAVTRRTANVAAAFTLGGVAALLLYFAPGPQRAGPVAPIHSVWTETKWPFLMDEWGEGRAFECKAADCGGDLKLYIRSKIGFCSSTTGVTDDSELDRLSDFDFMKGANVALDKGHEVEVGWMKGRLRTYANASPKRQASAISIAYNSNSDALVATVLLNDAKLNAVEPAIIEFLGGKEMLRWVKMTLGL